MAKRSKTRRDKVITDLRRKLATTVPESKEDTSSNHISSSKTGTYQLNSIPKVSTNSHRLPLTTSTEYIKKDLTKTLLLTLLAISFELILYFLLG